MESERTTEKRMLFSSLSLSERERYSIDTEAQDQRERFDLICVYWFSYRNRYEYSIHTGIQAHGHTNTYQARKHALYIPSHPHSHPHPHKKFDMCMSVYMYLSISVWAGISLSFVLACGPPRSCALCIIVAAFPHLRCLFFSFSNFHFLVIFLSGTSSSYDVRAPHV